jgi:hypothetical protein
MPDESVTGVPPGTTTGLPDTVPTPATPDPAASGEVRETEPGTQPVDLATELRQLSRRFQRFERDNEHDRRLRDKWGSEMGEIRNLLKGLPAQLTPGRDPVKENERYQNDPAGFISDKLDELMKRAGGVADGTTTPAPNEDTGGESREQFLQRIADASEDFQQDFPDVVKYHDQIDAMLRSETYRVYDRDGKLNVYKSIKSAYNDAVLAARGGRTTAAAAGRVAGAIEAAKAGASVTGVSASGAERATLKGLDPSQLRGKSRKELEALGQSLGLIPANDRPR